MTHRHSVFISQTEERSLDAVLTANVLEKSRLRTSLPDGTCLAPLAEVRARRSEIS